MVYVKLTLSFLAILDTKTPTTKNSSVRKREECRFLKINAKAMTEQLYFRKSVPGVAFSESITATIISSLNF